MKASPRRSPISRQRLIAGFLCLLLVAFLSSCRGMPSPFSPIHINPNMDSQEKAQPQEESAFFYDGMAMRQPVPGTVARGELREDSEYFTGRDRSGGFLTKNPEAVDEALAARGEERYTIYCQPCHDKRGTGDGILSQYGNVPTASFHDEQRSAYPDGQLFDVITNGSGLMASYAYQIPPHDRWAIIAHIRRLQQERIAREAGR